MRLPSRPCPTERVPTLPHSGVTSQLNISAVSGDGTTATYAYTLTAGHDLTPGVSVTVTGTGAGFDGTFLVAAIVMARCLSRYCFQVPNTTSGNGTAGSGAGSNIFPQITVVLGDVEHRQDHGRDAAVSGCHRPGFPILRGGLCQCALPLHDGCRRRQHSRLPVQLRWRNVNIVDTTSDDYIEKSAGPNQRARANSAEFAEPAAESRVSDCRSVEYVLKFVIRSPNCSSRAKRRNCCILLAQANAQDDPECMSDMTRG